LDGIEQKTLKLWKLPWPVLGHRTTRWELLSKTTETSHDTSLRMEIRIWNLGNMKQSVDTSATFGLLLLFHTVKWLDEYSGGIETNHAMSTKNYVLRTEGSPSFKSRHA